MEVEIFHRHKPLVLEPDPSHRERPVPRLRSRMQVVSYFKPTQHWKIFSITKDDVQYLYNFLSAVK